MQNPVKAGLADAPGGWPWSSYVHYNGGEDFITDATFADGFFSDRGALLAYLGQENEDRVMDERPRMPHVTDEKCAGIAARITGCQSPEVFRRLEKPVQREYILQLRKAHLSIAQISHVTGLPTTTVFRITKTE
jgi:hypothetical protein